MPLDLLNGGCGTGQGEMERVGNNCWNEEELEGF